MTEMALQDSGDIWKVSPEAADRRGFAWERGIFETARRGYTERVEGTICSSHHMIMVTLRGGARRHEMTTDCGHRYDGPDRAGMVSFLPANCQRVLKLQGVTWEWASIALPPELFLEEDDYPGNAQTPGSDFRAFGNVEDVFLFALLTELERLYSTDGHLEPAYCDAMSMALAQYVNRRYLSGTGGDRTVSATLPPWRLRRISDYVAANLHEDIRIAALASLVGLSEGHFHRSFRKTTGQTPLQFINQKRIDRATQILAREQMPILELALRVGFVSPSHFARVFRTVTGMEPSRYRKDLERGRAN